jgi:hypothetical protein
MTSFVAGGWRRAPRSIGAPSAVPEWQAGFLSLWGKRSGRVAPGRQLRGPAAPALPSQRAGSNCGMRPLGKRLRRSAKAQPGGFENRRRGRAGVGAQRQVDHGGFDLKVGEHSCETFGNGSSRYAIALDPAVKRRHHEGDPGGSQLKSVDQQLIADRRPFAGRDARPDRSAAPQTGTCRERAHGSRSRSSHMGRPLVRVPS